MKKIFYTFAVLILFLSSCTEDISEKRKASLFQVSVLDALMQGVYDGFYPLSDLLEYGSYGLGTFDKLNGEMVVLNDTVFQVLYSGEVTLPSGDVLTPFAAVANLNPDTVISLSGITYDDFKDNFINYVSTPNLFYLIKISGSFSYVKTRSVAAQEKPYPKLVDVTEDQAEFEFDTVNGDIIGLYCPEYAEGINAVGLHLHFLNSSRTGGGHLLAFNVIDATLQIGSLLNYELVLPEDGDFYDIDFEEDMSDDIEEAEK